MAPIAQVRPGDARGRCRGAAHARHDQGVGSIRTLAAEDAATRRRRASRSRRTAAGSCRRGAAVIVLEEWEMAARGAADRRARGLRSRNDSEHITRPSRGPSARACSRSSRPRSRRAMSAISMRTARALANDAGDGRDPAVRRAAERYP
jgi:hypothetical protein